MFLESFFSRTSDTMKSDSLWLRQSTADECTVDPVMGTTTGQVPSWLSGSMYRTGPGVFQYGEDKFKHAFDGTAILHAVDIRQVTTISAHSLKPINQRLL